jgi:hypothetical protein
MMTKYVFVLEPSKELFVPLSNLKKDLSKKVKATDYLTDPPHLTLFIGEFKETILSVLDNFPLKHYRLCSDRYLVSLNSFNTDPVTGKKTLFFKILGEDSLSKFQTSLINLINPFRIDRNFNRYESETFSKNKIFKSNLEKYGYPFVGDIWIPHISIGSFGREYPTKEIESFFQKIKETKFNFNKLVIYELKDDDSIIMRKDYILKKDI